MDAQNPKGGATGPTVKWLMTSTDFGNNYTYAQMPEDLQAKSLARPATTPSPSLLISYQDHHHAVLIELRQALISYQDHHMLSLSSGGRP